MILKDQNSFKLHLNKKFYPKQIIEQAVSQFRKICKINYTLSGGSFIVDIKSEEGEIPYEFLNHLLSLAHINKIYFAFSMQEKKEPLSEKKQEISGKLAGGFGYIPVTYKKIKDKYLVTSKVGSWAILEEKEFKRLMSQDIKKDTAIYKKLIENDIICSKKNVFRIVRNYRNLNLNLFQGPSLHIINLGSVCNQKCVYCHASANKKTTKLDKKIAMKFLETIFQTNSKAITIEFQGGETLLNWDILKFIVEHAIELNKIEKKVLKITLVSNLSLITEEQIDYLIKNSIYICTSLDGPKNVHDANRKFLDDSGTYDTLVQKIRAIREKLKKANKPNLLQALPTITRYSLKYPKEIVDEYVKLSFDTIHLRFLNYLGYAKENWKEIGYTAEGFNEFWRKALDYILELNRKGIPIKERGIMIMANKIFKKKDPLYTELMSPCGAGRVQLMYTENGDVYTCDEARTLGEDLFKLGNVMHNRYEEIVRNDVIKIVCQASITDISDPLSAFSQWSGTCPVVNYSERGNIITSASESFRNRIFNDQFLYIFEKIIEDSKNSKIFIKWIN